MTDNKRVTNKQILDKINSFEINEEDLNLLAIKVVSRMVKLKSTIMEICKQDEAYEKCAIIKNRMDEINKILRKYK